MQIRIKTAEEFHADHVTIEIQADRVDAVKVVEGFTSEDVARAQSSEAELVAAPLRARIEELEKQLVDGRTIGVTAAQDRIKELEGQLKRATSRYGHVCTDGCRPNSHVAFIGRERLTELEREVAGYREVIKTLQDEATSLKADRDAWKNRAEGWQHDRHTEKARADQLAAEMRQVRAQLHQQFTVEKVRLAAELRQVRAQLHQRFTAEQVQALKEDARAEARASEGARIRNEIRAIVNRPGVDDYLDDHEELGRLIRQVREYLEK